MAFAAAESFSALTTMSKSSELAVMDSGSNLLAASKLQLACVAITTPASITPGNSNKPRCNCISTTES
jgi:hypothetical protein